MRRSCHSCAHSDSRREHQKAHSLFLGTPDVVSRAGSARQSARARTRRSCPGTVSVVDLPGWLQRAISKTPVLLRSAIALPPTEPDTRTCDSTGPANTPAPRRSVLQPPDHAAFPNRVALGWRRCSLHPERSILAARYIRLLGRSRSTPPSGWQSCAAPSAGRKRLEHKSPRACSSFISESLGLD